MTPGSIKIEKVKGSCGCFHEYEGPQLIPAGTNTHGRLVFRAEGFDVEEGTTVAILSSYANKPVIAVKVTANSLTQHGVILTPRVLDVGLWSQAKSDGEFSFFLLKDGNTPIGFEGTTENSLSSDQRHVKTSVEKLSPFRLSEKTVSGYQIKVMLKNVPVGFFRFVITINLDEDSGGESTVLVTGYSVKT